jgi:ACR3 family arsenite efflux pump ArsB
MENKVTLPYAEIFIVVISYGTILLELLTSILGLNEEVVFGGVVFLFLIAPLGMIYIIFKKLWKLRTAKLVKLEKCIFIASVLYFLIAPLSIYLLSKYK